MATTRVKSYYDLVIQRDKTTTSHFDFVEAKAYEKKAHFDLFLNRPFSNLDYTSLSLNISASTLSDTLNIETYNPLNLGDEVKGRVLDKSYKFRVAETSRQYGSVLTRYTGRYDDNKLCYTRLSLSYAPNVYRYTDNKGKAHTVRYATAKQLAGVLSNRLGLKLVYRALDFIPSQCVYHSDKKDKQEAYKLEGTYQSILSQLFGWIGSKLPNIAVNVFIDKDTLYIIQRGREQNRAIIDHSGVVYAPTVSTKTVRTVWGGVGNNITAIETDEPNPFTGVIKFGDAENTYKDGYLQSEKHNKSVTYYKYDTIDETDSKYLMERLTLEIVSDLEYNGSIEYEGRVSKTTYHYTETATDIYMDTETERSGGEYMRTISNVGVSTQISETIDNINRYTDWSSAEKYITRYSPIGNGWYGVSKSSETENGEETVSTSLMQGAPGQKASQYTIDKTSTSLSDKQVLAHDLYVLTRLLLHGYTFWDNSLPLAIINNRLGLDMAAYISQQINDLNNKTEERMSLQVVGTSHVYDCNDLITFGGYEYHLDSNTVTHTPQGITQNLQLVRWR